MFDFAIGFTCGLLTTVIMWMVVHRPVKTVYVIKESDKPITIIEDNAPVVKPDNEKARYFSTPEYRAERAYVEGMKAKR